MTEWITKTKGLCYNVWKIIESEMPKLYQHLAYASEHGQSYSVEINLYFAIFRDSLLPSMDDSILVLVQKMQRLLSVWILNNSRKVFIFFLSIHLSFSISFFGKGAGEKGPYCFSGFTVLFMTLIHWYARIQVFPKFKYKNYTNKLHNSSAQCILFYKICV